MNCSRTIAASAALCFLLASCQTPATTSVDLSDGEFRQLDQRLLNAIAPGDQATWDGVLSADAVYVDENGSRFDRAAFLNELQPLPSGLSGRIDIVEHSVNRHGDVALIIHRDDETEDYFGQVLHANYVMTETWIRQPSGWKLALVHAYVVNHDPPAAVTEPAALDRYAGRYTGGSTLVYEIAREGDHLVGGRPGGVPRPLAVEATDVLFTPGEPRSRKIFRRDGTGAIIGFVDRREGIDIVWQRVR